MAADPRQDERRVGKYRIVERIGAGGMAEVFLARQEGPAGFSKDVVLKMILPGLTEENRFVTMFFNEARLAARLDHPNIVQVFDFGCERGRYFLAMEWVRGLTLRKIRSLCKKQNSPIPPRLLARVLCGVCQGLHHAHEMRGEDSEPLGIIHRDVSPDNIIVARDGTPKVLDFGIAKANDAAATTQGTLKGKYQYMAPELIQGEAIDRRVDVYAAGVVLYELLTGHRPFRGSETELLALLESIVKGQPTPIRELRPEVPEPLAAVAHKAMARDASARYASTQELRVALENYLASTGEAVLELHVARYLEELVARAGDEGASFARVFATPTSDGSALPAAAAGTPGIVPDETFDLANLGEQQRTIAEGVWRARARPLSRPDRPASGSRLKTIVAVLGLIAAAAAAGVGWRQLSSRRAAGGRTDPRGGAAADPPQALTSGAAEVEAEAATRNATAGGDAEGPETGNRAPVAGEVKAADVEFARAGDAGPELATGAGAGASDPEGTNGADAGAAPRPAGRPASRHSRDSRRKGEQARRTPHERGREAVAGTARLTVHAAPWCTIYVGSKKLGSTPLNGVKVSAGKQRIRCENRAEGIRATRTVTLSAGESASETFRFTRGALDVRVKPWGEVWVDGKKKGITPVGRIPLYAGRHSVRIVNGDLDRTVNRRVTISDQKTTTLRIDLTK